MPLPPESDSQCGSGTGQIWVDLVQAHQQRRVQPPARRGLAELRRDVMHLGGHGGEQRGDGGLFGDGLGDQVHGAPVGEEVRDVEPAARAGENAAARAGSDRMPIFNVAAQAWNHDFYWKSMMPGKSKPDERLTKMIDASFGSYDNFIKELQNAAVTQFGSGWAWLVLDQGKLT